MQDHCASKIEVDKLEIIPRDWPIAGTFTISRGARTTAHTLEVRFHGGGFTGQGECVPYPRYGESVESVAAQIEAARSAIGNAVSRQALMEILPPGAARNAVDCALWDLQAKQSGLPAWQIAGIEPPQPVETAYTISLGTPEAMAAQTGGVRERSLLKVKLGGEGDEARMRAVREAAPDTRIILDANEAWPENQLARFMAVAAETGAALVEQPLPSGNDRALASLDRLVPVCADESLHTRDGLEALCDRYDCINIKLDKTGGLTEALLLLQAARQLDFRIMVGCMVGSSLAMAPAMLLAANADFVDLDGPLLLASDRDHPLSYPGSQVTPPTPQLWG